MSSRARSIMLAFAIGALVLGGCGGQPAAEPTAPPEPTVAPTRTPRPTSTPMPTAPPEPTATAEPTEEPTTVATNPGELQEVIIGSLETYEYETGVFRIDVPSNWTRSDNSSASEVIIVWTDPSENAAIIVDIFEDETTLSDDDLIELLTNFLNNSFSDEPDFSIDDPSPQSDGSILLVWSYTATADNDVPAPLLGNSFVEQRGNKVSILTTLVPQDQFEDLVDNTNEIINTYAIDPDAPLTSGGSGSSGGGSTASSSAPGEVFAVGEPVQFGNLIITVDESGPVAATQFFNPDAGNTFYQVTLTMENTGSSSAFVSTLLQMSLIDDNGATYEVDIVAMTAATQASGASSADGEITAGSSATGLVGFQVPTNASGLVFVFKDLLEDSSIGFALE